MQKRLPGNCISFRDAPEFFTFSCWVVSSSLGSFMFMAVLWLMVVVNTKKVISRKPRSTIGVRSTLVDSFLDFFTPGPFLWPPPDEVSISAISNIFGVYSDDMGATWSTPVNLTNTAETRKENFNVSV